MERSRSNGGDLDTAPRNPWLAGWRFLRLAIIASRGIASLLIESARGRWTRANAAQAAARCSRKLCAALGIRVVHSGPVPFRGPVLLVANHRSYVDPVALLAALPCCLVAKSEVARWPLIGLGSRLAGSVFVRRDDRRSRAAARATVAECLRAGTTVAAFPEGTTTAGPGLLPFRRGLFESAAAAGTQVVPVAITYDDRDDAWIGDDTFLSHFAWVFAKRETVVRVEFGPAFSSPDPSVLLDLVQSWIERRLADMEGVPWEILLRGGLNAKLEDRPMHAVPLPARAHAR